VRFVFANIGYITHQTFGREIFLRYHKLNFANLLLPSYTAHFTLQIPVSAPFAKENLSRN